MIQTCGDSEYRLNNNWRAFYARTVPLVAPDLAGFFAVRVQATEWKPNLEELEL